MCAKLQIECGDHISGKSFDQDQQIELFKIELISCKLISYLR